MATLTDKQEFSFQAEIKQLLHLLSHSLYQSRDIAIRELVSNASDALDKMRYIALTDEASRETGPLEIAIEGNQEGAQLVIRDNGIGMTHAELVENLGTIARSGSLEFLKNLASTGGGTGTGAGAGKADISLIGQFGVGFYSAFMIADKVRVRTRSYREEAGWEWESDGSGTYTITPAEGPGLARGTEVVLHLKEDARDFADDWRLKSVLTRYSSFVPHPIRLAGAIVNTQKPIWVEPKGQVGAEQYQQFYQHLTHGTGDSPLWHLHLAADSPIQFRAILYAPPTNVERLGFGRAEHGLSLCAQRILVRSDCRDLLPEYLRFLYGLVDSEDLPLNVSRETLQDNTVIRRVRNTLVKGVLDKLQQLADDSPEAYRAFYEQFGANLKEGVATAAPDRERLAKLLRFASTHDETPGALTALGTYVQRAKPDQDRIYYLGGPDLASLRKSPNLEVFRRRGIEVLFLADPIDEFVMSSLPKFEEKLLTSIDAADLGLPADEPKARPDEPTAAGFGRVLDLFREALGDRAGEVRESNRLTDSPCCLVNAEGGLSTQMQRLLKMANKDFPASKRIFEVNPSAPLIKRLSSLAANREHDGFIARCGLQLWASATLLEGALTEPEAMVTRVQSFMEEAADKRSPIVF